MSDEIPERRQDDRLLGRIEGHMDHVAKFMERTEREREQDNKANRDTHGELFTAIKDLRAEMQTAIDTKAESLSVEITGVRNAGTATSLKVAGVAGAMLGAWEMVKAMWHGGPPPAH